jgi:hypothetical protein
LLCAWRIDLRDVVAEGLERRDLDPDGERVADQSTRGTNGNCPLQDKDQTMGYSTPKTPFDLTEFLSQTGKPKFVRKSVWNRRPAVTPKAPDTPVEPTARQAPDPV